MPITPVHTTAVSERIEQGAVHMVECTVPAEMTLDEWRLSRPRVPRRRLRPRRSRTPEAARHLELVSSTSIDPAPLAA